MTTSREVDRSVLGESYRAQPLGSTVQWLLDPGPIRWESPGGRGADEAGEGEFSPGDL